MLGANGLLPTGLHRVTVDQVHSAFVAPFPTSANRQKLYEQWLLHREAIATLVPVQRQWLNGSYVTAKVDPGDVDVVTFVDGAVLEALDPAPLALLESLVSGHDTRDLWGIDSFLVATYAEDHPAYATSRRTEGAWRRTWTNVKGTDLTKGFLEVGT